MDTKGIIQEHTKDKLELYRLYLERYLAVLLVQNFFREITINDIFAGCGYAENNEKGSALIAAEVISESLDKAQTNQKTINLYLNDASEKNYLKLQEYLKGFSFASITNQAADDLISQWVPGSDQTHNFFFIDPHGYSQINGSNLKNLFSRGYSDFLIFVPIYHVYRFLRKESYEEQLKPIARFLSDLGIDETQATNSEDLEDFAELVRKALAGLSGKEFCFKQMLKNTSSNSQYCLFFISGNILGAEKFLDAQAKLKASKELQQSFEFIDRNDNRSKVLGILSGGPYNNRQMYEQGIKAGLLSKQIGAELKELENENRIKVEELPLAERKRKGFYVNYSSYTKDRFPKITIELIS